MTQKDYKIDMVIIHKNRYFGICFQEKKVREITFNEAFGHNFFDWDNMICLASDENKRNYSLMRGKDGLGFGNVCSEMQ